MRLVVAIVSLSAAIAGGAAAAHGQGEEGTGVSREYAIKAAYLYQFSRYIQWPGDASGSGHAAFAIGVVEPDPFGNALDELARTKKVEGRPILVKRFTTADDYAPCQILFVPSSASPAEKQAVLRKTRGSPVLVVGEDPSFVRQGGAFSFFLEENKVRFEVNLDAARQQHLKISSKLLSLAKIVGGP